MKLERKVLNSALFASLGALLIGCGDATLLPIDGPASGGGGSTSSSGGQGGNGGGGVGGDPLPSDPHLVHVHADGVEVYWNLHNTEPYTGNWLGDYDGAAFAAAQVGDDVVLGVIEASINQARLWKLPGLANFGNGPPTASAVLTFDPVGASSQLLYALRGDDAGSLWLTTAGVTSVGAPANTLRWSPNGDMDGPWIVYNAQPAINDWELLSDQSTIVAAIAGGLQLLHVDRDAQTLTKTGNGFGHNYAAVGAHAGSFYAVTDFCTATADCSYSGELHIWRDIDADPGKLQFVPDVVNQLPQSNARACSLSVGNNGLVVGACAGSIEEPAEPRLHFYDDPGQIVDATTPTVIQLSANPSKLESLHWGSSDMFGRTLSVYIHTPTTGLLYEDQMGGPLSYSNTFGSPMVPSGDSRDILIVD